MQTNDLCKIELFEIELFDHLTLCKQMFELLVNLELSNFLTYVYKTDIYE